MPNDFPLRFKDKNLYQPVKQILSQNQFRRNNANAMYEILGILLMNKNMFYYFELLFDLVVDKTMHIYITYKECKISQRKIYKIRIKKTE